LKKDILGILNVVFKPVQKSEFLVAYPLQYQIEFNNWRPLVVDGANIDIL